MATFSIENFGCRATEADAAAMRRDLLQRRTRARSEQHAAADVVVLNTCTVTAAADSQARDAVRKIHRANPAARIVVTGCYAQRAPEELAQLRRRRFLGGWEIRIKRKFRACCGNCLRTAKRRRGAIARREFLRESLNRVARISCRSPPSTPNRCRSRAARPKS